MAKENVYSRYAVIVEEFYYIGLLLGFFLSKLSLAKFYSLVHTLL